MGLTQLPAAAGPHNDGKGGTRARSPAFQTFIFLKAFYAIKSSSRIKISARWSLEMLKMWGHTEQETAASKEGKRLLMALRSRHSASQIITRFWVWWGATWRTSSAAEIVPITSRQWRGKAWGRCPRRHRRCCGCGPPTTGLTAE